MLPIGTRKWRLIGFSLLRISRVIRQISIAISDELVRQAEGKRAHGVYVYASFLTCVFGTSITFTEHSMRNATQKVVFRTDTLLLYARSNGRARVSVELSFANVCMRFINIFIVFVSMRHLFRLECPRWRRRNRPRRAAERQLVKTKVGQMKVISH